MRPIIHIALHFAVPAAIALLFFRPRLYVALAILLGGIAIDVDHLVADPIYDPNRCSVGFHPLHTYPFVIVYAALALFPATRLVGVSLVVHIMLDLIDCGWMHRFG